MVFQWREILKFFKKNIIKLLIGTVIFTLIFAFIRSIPSEDNKAEEITEIEETSEENDTEFVKYYTEVDPAKFNFYIRHDDGRAFTNHQLIEQYVFTRENLQEISSEINIDLQEIIGETGNRIFKKDNYLVEDTEGSKIIGFSINDTTNLMEFHANIGDEQNNLIIANYFYNFIMEDRIPFLTTNNIYTFKEPGIVEEDVNYDILSEEQIVEDIQAREENTLVTDIIMGTVLGLLLTSLGLWIITLFSSKLNYSFSYLLKENDIFMLIDGKTNKEEELFQLLEIPNESNRIVVYEKNVKEINTNVHNVFKQSASKKSYKEIQSIVDIQNPHKVDRLVYIIVEDETTRDWYKKQRNLDKHYDIPTFIIQINKNTV